MSEHTPGPWKATRASKASNFGGYRAGVFGPEAARIAYVHGGNSDERSVAEANALLTAAAPDLLAALRGYQREAMAYHKVCGHGVEGCVAECDTICDQMEAGAAAIAKAAGR